MISTKRAGSATVVPKTERKAWARENLKGIEGTLRPTFTPDFQGLDEDGIRHDVRESIRMGFCSVLCSAPGLSLEEKKRFLTIAADEAQGRINLCAVADDDVADISLEILAHAEAVGCSHAMVRVPNHPDQSEDSLFADYRVLVDATNLGICLFATSKAAFAHLHPSGIPLGLLRRLAQIPNVVGIKLTQWLSAAHVYECCEHLADLILVNSANLNIIPLIAKGYPVQWTGQWNIQAVQSVDQPNAVDFMKRLNAGKLDEAMAIYWRIHPAFEAFAALQRPFLQRGSHPWTHLKYYQWCVGGNGGLYRDVDKTDGAILDAEGRKKIRESYRSIGVRIEDRPEDEFLVGRAAYAKGVRPADLTSRPCWR